MISLLLLFLVVFLLNVIPAFAPPTWMVFSFLGFRFPSHMTWTMALIGALAAVMGRAVLALVSRSIVRNRWLGQAGKENVDSLKVALEKRPKLTFGLFLFYAFTPMPSNYLFIAYGLTAMPLLRILVPFFIGRFVSYQLWTMSGAIVSRRLELEGTEAFTYFSIYFVFTQIVLLALVYAFTRVDWRVLLGQKKFRWLAKSKPNFSD
jgi:membrane protein DedA with SNARE-associated domain